MTVHGAAYEYVAPAVLDPVLIALAEHLVFAIPLVLVALWFTGRSGKLDGLFVFAAVVAGIALSYGLGLLYAHPPPYQVQPDTVLSGPPTNAFPSQHATAAFGMVPPLLARGRRRLAAGFLVVAALVAFGRVATGLHFPVDVAGGVLASLLGFGVVWLGSASVEAWARSVVATEARLLGYLGRFVP